MQVRERRLLLDRCDEWLFEEIEPFVGQRVLEVGCGLGNLTRHLLNRDLAVGIDISPESVLEIGRRYADRVNVQAVVYDITDPSVLDLAHHRFDTTISLNVLEHIGDDVLALKHMARLVRPGGYLLYSTCTFAPEEDEGAVQSLLETFPDFKVVALPQLDGFAPGQPGWLETLTGQQADSTLKGAARLFPHRLAGEGHFACLLRKSDVGTEWTTEEAEKRIEGKRLGKRKVARKTEQPDLRFWREFARDALHVHLAEERLRMVGERLYYLPEENLDFGRLRVVHPGVWLGSLKKGRFEPAHPLALFLKPSEMKDFVSFPADSRALAAYLRGESLEIDASGWTVVCADGWPLGWGKGVQGTLKNHFPRGWL